MGVFHVVASEQAQPTQRVRRPQQDVATPPTPGGSLDTAVACAGPREIVVRVRFGVIGLRQAVRHPVVLVGLAMGAAQLLFRAWAVYPSWFFADDYVLLHDAQGTKITSSYLLWDFNSNLIPAVRLIASWVANSGELNWPLAATIVLALQAFANIAAVVMLVTLFGTRWGVLAPLAVYLTSAVTMPAFMWWVASVSQLPFQIAFFLAVTTWVAYLRSRRLSWLAATLALVVLALFCYTKSLLIGPVLAFVAVVYFVRGDPWARVVACIRRYWPAVIGGGLIVGGYVVYYVTEVPQPFEDPSRQQFGEVIGTVLGTSFPTSLLGGPWRWWDTTPPVVLASPPGWTVHLAWVVIAGVLAYSLLTRRRALGGWLLIFGYAVGLSLLLAGSRGQLYGQLSGLEYRYLTDLACVAALGIGLVFLPLHGAVGASSSRETPLLLVRVPTAVVVALVAVVSVGGVVSTIQYVGFWHHDNAGRGYTRTLQQDLAEGTPPSLIEQIMPGNVMPDYTTPVNTTPVFTELYDEQVTFPLVTDRLQLIDDNGSLQNAVIQTGVKAPPGPVDGCGWPVKASGRTIELDGSTFDFGWWLRIGYLASDDSPVTVSAGETTVEGHVNRGLHSLFVRVDGAFDEVTLSGLDSGTSLCVDALEVGLPTTGPGA